MDHRIAALLAAAGFSLCLLVPQPAAAAKDTGSVLNQEQREFTRQRQLHGNFVEDEAQVKAETAAVPPTETAAKTASKTAATTASKSAVKVIPKTAAKVTPKLQTVQPLSKNSSYREAQPDNSRYKTVKRSKKDRRSVLTPEEEQFTRSRQEDMNKGESQVLVSDSGIKNTADHKSGSAKGNKYDHRPAYAEKTKSDYRQANVKETPAAYKPQYLLPGEFKSLTIFGPAIATEEQAVAVLHQVNPQPQIQCSPKQLVRYYWEEAGQEGIRPDVAFAQAIVETGSFRYGGDVHPGQNNYCGLGTVGGGKKGASFASPALGVRAHIQHLLAYTDQRPRTQIIDPRYEMAHKVRQANGFCTTWTQLNGTWAMGGYYAEKIMTVWERMLNNKGLDGVPVQSDVLAYGRKGR